MDNPFEMKLHTEEGGRFSINVRKNYLEFIFEDGTTKAAGCLTRAELKDLAKMCQYIWENSAPLMRKVKEEEAIPQVTMTEASKGGLNIIERDGMSQKLRDILDQQIKRERFNEKNY